jgi:hypothetical protein
LTVKVIGPECTVLADGVHPSLVRVTETVLVADPDDGLDAAAGVPELDPLLPQALRHRAAEAARASGATATDRGRDGLRAGGTHMTDGFLSGLRDE